VVIWIESKIAPFPLKPNAGTHLLLEAAARYERTL
jgi:hypothetical protein